MASDAKILVVGAGGLGIPAAWALAREGAKSLTLVDPDPVELSNLPRQFIFTNADIGRPKVEAAREHLATRFPAVSIDARAIALDESNAADLIGAHSFVIDATDNPSVKFLINDTCVGLGIPFVYAGAIGTRGQAMTVLPGRSACLRCLFEEPPGEDEAASCRDAGIIGPVAGAIGEIEAAEALRYVTGLNPHMAGRILTYDAGARPRVRVASVGARPGCTCDAFAAATAEANRGSKENDELHH
jgi:molybdopterin-synthase adenylyltransferase